MSNSTVKYSPSSRLLLVFLITSVDRLPGAFEQIAQLFTAKLRCFYYLEFKDLDSIQPFQLMTGTTPRPCLYPSLAFYIQGESLLLLDRHHLSLLDICLCKYYLHRNTATRASA